MKKAGKILLVIACVIGVAVGGVRLVPPRKRTGRTGGSHAPGHAEPEYQRGGHHIRGNPVQQGDPRRHAGRSGKGSCELSSFPIRKKRNVQSERQINKSSEPPESRCTAGQQEATPVK